MCKGTEILFMLYKLWSFFGFLILIYVMVHILTLRAVYITATFFQAETQFRLLL